MHHRGWCYGLSKFKRCLACFEGVYVNRIMIFDEAWWHLDKISYYGRGKTYSFKQLNVIDKYISSQKERSHTQYVLQREANAEQEQAFYKFLVDKHRRKLLSVLGHPPNVFEGVF